MAHTRDITIGHATILFCGAGWRLIGGGVTTDYKTAVRHAVEIDRLITRATAH